MKLRIAAIAIVAAGLGLAVANCSTEENTGTGGAAASGGNGTGGTHQGGNAAGNGGTAAAGGIGATGGTGPCVPVVCVNQTYACADCIDNDNDGLVDSADPDCLGPCHNSESAFDLHIPGGDNAPCKKDCYYDQNSGSGNDDCYWDHRCDPLEPSLVPEGCTCNPDGNGGCVPPASADCPDPQSTTCHDTCGPLTPNGCDCFGCCELPAGSGTYVYIGTENVINGTDTPTCTLAVMSDTTLCHPCTPVGDCLNDCGHCELCLGKTELPPDCLSDAGTGGSGGNSQCPPGIQPCGLAGQEPCFVGSYCITGCCQFIPN